MTVSNADASAHTAPGRRTSARLRRFGNWRRPREDVANSDRFARGRNSYRRKLIWKLREALRMRKAFTVSENSYTDCP